MHETGPGELAHPGIDDRVAGSALLPRLEGGLRLRTGIEFDAVEIWVPVVPRAARPLMQNRGVEVTECQLAEVGGRPGVGGAEIGRHGPGVDGAELQMCRHPAGSGLVRPVAIGGVIRNGTCEKFRPAVPGRRFTGWNIQCCNGIRRIHRIGECGCAGGINPGDRGRIGLRRRAPPDFPPAPVERGEHLVRTAVVLGHPTRRHQIRRTGGDEWDPGKTRGDRIVATHPERTEVSRDVHRFGADRRGDLRDLLFGPPAGDQQPPVEVAVEAAQAVAEELQTARAGAGLQSGIQHEAGQYLGAVGGGVKQRWKVAQSQVAAKPQQRRGHRTMVPCRFARKEGRSLSRRALFVVSAANCSLRRAVRRAFRAFVLR